LFISDPVIYTVTAIGRRGQDTATVATAKTACRYVLDCVSYYLISPAISNGLSFNKKTGTISGVPIVASDGDERI
jgi:hypothetical protein